MDNSHNAIAEILTASITALTAETLPQGDKPQFGSFIRVESPENKNRIFAVVFDVVTGSPDSVHKPSALGLTREQLKVEQPHIFALLKTHLQAAIVGYSKEGRTFQHLPPQPPDVHDFVYYAGDEEIRTLSSDFEYLRLLVHVNAVPTDELIAASIRQAALAQAPEERSDYLVEAGRAISHLFRTDYERMVSIVKKIKPQSL